MRKKHNAFLKKVSHASTYEEILSNLMTGLMQELHLKQCVLFSCTHDQLKVKMARGVSAAFINTASLSMNDPCVLKAFASHEGVLSGTDFPLENNPGNVYVFPLSIKNMKIGISVMASDRVFHDDDLTLFENISMLAAFILKTMHLDEMVHNMAVYDEETGAYSASYFYIKLQEVLERLRRHKQSFAVFYTRYHEFIELKKRYGSGTMDMAVSGLAKTIKKHIRTIDTISMHGGTGLMVILENPEEVSIIDVINRIEKEMGNYLKEKEISARFDKGLVYVRRLKTIDDILELLEESIYESSRMNNLVIIDK